MLHFTFNFMFYPTTSSPEKFERPMRRKNINIFFSQLETLKILKTTEKLMYTKFCNIQ